MEAELRVENARLKAELAFPSPTKLAADPAVLVPWHHRSNYNTTPEPDHTPHGGKRVTDTFMLVPRPGILSVYDCACEYS